MPTIMKELTIEEKAKRFDEVFGKARRYYDEYKTRDNILYVEDMEDMFPELKESKDESIRKELLNAFQESEDSLYMVLTPHRRESFIAWLEKQGKNNMGISEATKQKLEDNLNKALAKETPESWNEFLDRQGEQKEINLVEILKHYPRETELYSPLYGKLWLAEVDEEHEIIICYKHQLDEGCVRAILEQEDTVSFYSDGTTGLPDFSVSKNCMLFLYDVEKQGIQKPTDYPLAHEKMEPERWGQACKAACCDRNYRSHNGLTETRDDYFVDGVHWADEHPKQNPGWSEEDDSTHTRILGALGKVFMGFFPTKPSREDIEWFKFLPKRFSLRPNQEWSEEDEKILEMIISDYSAASTSFCGHQGKLDWLKLLKERYTWKPSDEQLKAIRLARSFVTDDFSDNPTLSEILIELENQLKKLMG